MYTCVNIYTYIHIHVCTYVNIHLYIHKCNTYILEAKDCVSFINLSLRTICLYPCFIIYVFVIYIESSNGPYINDDNER